MGEWPAGTSGAKPEKKQLEVLDLDHIQRILRRFAPSLITGIVRGSHLTAASKRFTFTKLGTFS